MITDNISGFIYPLPRIARQITVLAISHDDRYFHLADRCIKLEEGQIIAIEYPHNHVQHTR